MYVGLSANINFSKMSINIYYLWLYKLVGRPLQMEGHCIWQKESQQQQLMISDHFFLSLVDFSSVVISFSISLGCCICSNFSACHLVFFSEWCNWIHWVLGYLCDVNWKDRCHHGQNYFLPCFIWRKLK